MQHSEIVDYITASLPGVVAIYRFGSHGSVYERTDSDVDLAILGRSLIDSMATWNLSEDLAIRVGRQVDLIDLAVASTVLQAQIVSSGERFFCADPGYCDSYEVYVLSAYARLNEERKDILREALSRGSIYG